MIDKVVNGIVLVCALAGTAVATPPDACQLRFPKSLAHALVDRFPEHRLPTLRDLSAPDRAAWLKSQGGDACLLTAVADFDGDGSLDVAAVMPSRKGESAILIVALDRRGGWDVSSLPFWGNAARAYVQLLPPGTYRRPDSVDHEAAPPERKSITSHGVGFVSGTMEATGVAYFYDHGSWIYVWIAS
jgi:hypothetical protein